MRKMFIGAAVLGAGLAALRFGPALAERGMKKCHEMMEGMSQGHQEACGCAPQPSKAATN